MTVLEANPVASTSTFLNHLFGYDILTLAKRNRLKLLVHTLVNGQLLKVSDGVRTWRQDEDDRRDVR